MKNFARKFVAAMIAWMNTRVHCYNGNSWQVQILGKMWNTVHCDDAIVQLLGIHPRMLALFDTKAEAKAYLREYRKRLVAMLAEVD